jgi:hypothetical protein
MTGCGLICGCSYVRVCFAFVSEPCIKDNVLLMRYQSSSELPDQVSSEHDGFRDCYCYYLKAGDSNDNHAQHRCGCD